MANLNRSRHGSRYSQIMLVENGSLSTSKSGTNIGEWDRFGFCIRWNGKDGNGVAESFEIAMDKNEAEKQLKSLADMLGYQVTNK